MRNFIYFIINNVTTLLFLVIEVLCVVLIVNYNSYQRASFWGSSNVVCGAMYSLQSNVSEYFALREANEVLLADNVRLRNMLSKRDKVLHTFSDSLVATAMVGNEQKYFYRAASVINSSTNKSRNYLTLDKGSKAGIAPNMVVMNSQGVVGLVIATSAHYSSVLPIINTSFRLSVKLSSSNFRGQLVWNGVSPLRATMVDVPEHAVVSVGDTVVTSGSSNYFPEGMHVGIVEEVDADRNGGFYNLKVRLGVDYASIYDVEVIENREQKEQMELEKQNDND